jgi:CheY-like chemotaxis protein
LLAIIVVSDNFLFKTKYLFLLKKPGYQPEASSQKLSLGMKFYVSIHMRIGPIILVEDDLDDQEMMMDVFKLLQVPNEIKIFDTAVAAFDYLLSTNDKPFIIFSDVNLPKMTGAQLKKKINENDRLRRRSIPFVFLTTTSSHPAVLEAFDNNAQGFFTKPHDMRSLKEMVEMILNYWKLSRHPDPNLI